MTTTISNLITGAKRSVLISAIFFSVFVPLQTEAQNIDLTSCSTDTHIFELNASGPVNETILALNSNGNVFWEFFNVPPGATSTDGLVTNFSIDGITVTLPAGTPDAVAETEPVTITGTPASTGSIFFALTVTDETDGSLTCNQDYELRISRPLDVVLVLDRSGSMNTSTTTGNTRWEALTDAASEFGNLYQNTGSDEDRLSITYFDTDLAPSSACCNGWVNVNSGLGNTVRNDIEANSPGGLTAMGLGMQNAESKLTTPDHSKAIVLFTDGRQNQNPRVRTDGTGYENPAGSISSGITIATIGIGSPDGNYHTTLLNLALENGGSYNVTEDGVAFAFEDGNLAGDLSSGFAESYITMLRGSSPLVIQRTSSPVSADSLTLQSFPLNRHVDKLLLQFAFDRRFETPELTQLLNNIHIAKDGNPVLHYARPSWVGGYTNTLLLTFDFNAPPPSTAAVPRLDPQGDWRVRISGASNRRIGHVNLTSIADDHRLEINRTFDNPIPAVGESFPMNVQVTWMGHPVEDALVEAIVMKPGEDLGDLLARHPLTVDTPGGDDPALPGTLKFEELWQNDPDFREQLQLSENLISLGHAGEGQYEGTFNSLDVAGVYRLVFRVTGDLPEAGSFHRTLTESIYTTFGDVDMAGSLVSTQILNGNQLVMNFRPITTYGRYVGPAMGDGFKIQDPDVDIDQIEDHQDGSYTITFTGEIDKNVTLELIGREIYTGRLENAGQPGVDFGRIIDIIREWLQSVGLPGWFLWILLLILLLLILLLFRRK